MDVQDRRNERRPLLCDNQTVNSSTTRPASVLLVLLLLAAATVVAPRALAQPVAPTSSGPASLQIIDPAAPVDHFTGVDIALDIDNRPVVAYVQRSELPNQPDLPTVATLWVLRCESVSCAGPLSLANITAGEPFQPQIAIDPQDRPIVAFRDFADSTLKVLRCRATDCQSVEGPELLLTLDAFDLTNSTTLELTADGAPVVGAPRTSPSDFGQPVTYMTTTCLDPDCESTHTQVAGDGRLFQQADFTLSPDGSMTVVQTRPAEITVEYRPCIDGQCESTVTAVSTTSLGYNVDIETGPTGLSTIAISDSSIDIVRCLDANCSQTVGTSPLAISEDFVGGLTLAVGVDDVPIVSYWSQTPGNHVKVLRCSDSACEPEHSTLHEVITGAQFPFGVALNSLGHPVIAAGVGSQSVAVAVCDSPGCGVAATCSGFEVTVDLNAGESPTGGDDVIAGTPGDDVIAAGAGDDIICGHGGNDSIWGQAGDDLIFGGDDDDRLRGGADRDELWGEAGADDINGGTGADRIRGGDGADVALRGGPGDDSVNGGPGDDVLINGNGGRDYVFGGSGNDQLIAGGPRPDVLGGDEGDDVLRGNGGADELIGGFGDDDLRGGPQGDELHGGPGTDICNGGTTGSDATEFDTAETCETVTQVP